MNLFPKKKKRVTFVILVHSRRVRFNNVCGGNVSEAASAKSVQSVVNVRSNSRVFIFPLSKNASKTLTGVILGCGDFFSNFAADVGLIPPPFLTG